MLPRFMSQPQENIRTLLVEDELHTRRYMRELLAAESDIVVIGEASSGSEGARQIHALAPDLVFLDVQMPELDGFEMIGRIGVNRMPAFIFVTGYSNYALRAFEVEALDYICKPFDRDRLLASLDRARRHIRLRRERAEDHREAEQKIRQEFSRIQIHEKDGITFVPIENILWIEAADKYVLIHTTSGTHTVRQTIHSLEGKLDPKQFVRIHRSMVVRKAAVRGLHPLFHGDYIINLIDGTELRLTRSFRESFFSQMGC